MSQHHSKEVQNVAYTSQWTPSPSPPPLPPRAAGHRSTRVKCFGKARRGTDVVSSDKRGSLGYPRRTRIMRGTKRSTRGQLDSTARHTSEAISVPRTEIKSGLTSLKDPPLPQAEPLLRRLPSPYSPKISELWIDSAEKLSAVEMLIPEHSEVAGYATGTKSPRIRFALSRPPPTMDAPSIIPDLALPRYPLASTSTRPPLPRIPTAAENDTSRVLPRISESVSPAMRMSALPQRPIATALNFLEFETPSPVRNTSCASPYPGPKSFVDAEQHTSLNSGAKPKNGHRSDFSTSLTERPSPPPFLPLQCFQPFEGFEVEYQRADDSPTARAVLYASGWPPQHANGRSPLAAPKDHSLGPSKATGRAHDAAKKGCHLEDPLRRRNSVGGASDLQNGRMGKQPEGVTVSSSAMRVANQVQPWRYAKDTGLVHARIKAGLFGQQPSTSSAVSLRLQSSAATAFLDTDQREPVDPGSQVKKVLQQQPDRPLSASRGNRANWMRQTFRDSEIALAVADIPVFESSPSSTREVRLKQQTACDVKDRHLDSWRESAAKQDLQSQIRQDGRLGSGCKKGFSSSDITRWLSKVSAG